MGFKNFIQPGRVAYVNFGTDYGKVCIIVDFLDQNRVLVDGPTTGFPRVVYPTKRLTLTSLKIDILKGARTGTVKAAADKYGLDAKWKDSAIAKKMTFKAKRASMNDFERFKVMVNRKNKSFKIRQLAHQINGGAKAAPAKAAQAKKPAKS